jgi:hypothetical protein
MHSTFISLLKNYKAEDETICQIIGFKYQSLTQREKLQQQQQQQLLVDTNSSSSDVQQQHQADIFVYNLESKANMLYTITSYLLKYKMIDLDLLVTHVTQNHFIFNKLNNNNNNYNK